MPEFIVTFKPSATDRDIEKAKEDIVAKGGCIGHVYTLIRGFSATIPDGPAIAMLEASPHVENVERDQMVTTM